MWQTEHMPASHAALHARGTDRIIKGEALLVGVGAQMHRLLGPLVRYLVGDGDLVYVVHHHVVASDRLGVHDCVHCVPPRTPPHTPTHVNVPH